MKFANLHNIKSASDFIAQAKKALNKPRKRKLKKPSHILKRCIATTRNEMRNIAHTQTNKLIDKAKFKIALHHSQIAESDVKGWKQEASDFQKATDYEIIENLVALNEIINHCVGKNALWDKMGLFYSRSRFLRLMSEAKAFTKAYKGREDKFMPTGFLVGLQNSLFTSDELVNQKIA